MESEYDYTLEISLVKDTGNNSMKTKEEFSFSAVDNAATGKYIAGVQMINGTTLYVNVNNSYVVNNAHAASKITAVRDTASNLVYPVTDSMVQYRNGSAELENGDFIFDIYSNTIGLPSFYAGGTFELLTGTAGNYTVLYTFESKFDDNAIELDAEGNLTFEDAEEGVTVNVYNFADNSEILTTTLGEGASIVTLSAEELTAAQEAKDVLVTIVKNGNVIAAKKVSVAQPEVVQPAEGQ
jgi:hypothetical protein